MKANAPEKIFLERILCSNEVYDTWKSQKTISDDIEYVRKDVFIEKACEFFSEHLWEYIDVKNANCDTFINIDGDKLEEDFRNYIKGE